MHFADTFEIRTEGRGISDITATVQEMVDSSRIKEGLCTLFIHHTSASLIISENADPDVKRDLDAFLCRLVPDGDALYLHTDEGVDDMPSHVRSCLTQTSLSIPIRQGRCDLGVWQGIFLWEHRKTPHSRRVSITVIG